MNVRGSHILVADEEPECSRILSGALTKDGYRVQLAADGEAACQVMADNNVDLVIADLIIPGIDGFGVLQRAKETRPSIPVILVSGFGTVETAVQAIKMGAYYYFQKPLDLEAVRAVVSEALDAVSPPLRAPEAPSDIPKQTAPLDLGIVGQGRWFEEIMGLLRKLAPTRATALLEGESGSGKELFARAIHTMSGRKGPFVAVSCSALSRDLLESELFGHEKGAFTGADRQKPGRFELADGGTLLLDEVGDIPRDLQVKLLRVLQERQFERVGGTKSIDVDVRIVAASNRNLAAAVREGAFREDLYYRLKVVEIDLPPLRERPEDIELLTQRFVETYSRANGKRVRQAGKDVIELLQSYPWPGNVRELENAVERAVVLSEPQATELDVALLPHSIRSGTPTLFLNGGSMGANPRPGREASGSPQNIDEPTWVRALGDALRRTNGNAAGAARLLGVSAAVVRRSADKYGLREKRRRRSKG